MCESQFIEGRQRNVAYCKTLLGFESGPRFEVGFKLTLALRCTLNNTRQIEELDFGVVVVNDAGNAGEGGELHAPAHIM